MFCLVMKFIQSGFNLKVNRVKNQNTTVKNVFERHVLKCPMASGRVAIKEKLSWIDCD